MHPRIEEAIAECRAAMEQPNSYYYLPDIIQQLENMNKRLRDSEDGRIRKARAIGHFVLDNFAFTNSPLGLKLCKLIDDYEAGELSAP